MEDAGGRRPNHLVECMYDGSEPTGFIAQPPGDAPPALHRIQRC